MSQPQPIRRICPYLGVTGDPASHFRDADPAHYCYSPKKPGGVELDYQTNVCFAASYATCPRFVVPSAQIKMPGLATASSNRRLLWWLLAAFILIPLLVLGVFVSLVAPRATVPPTVPPLPVVATNIAQATATVTPSATPTLSQPPTLIPTPQLLIIPTPPPNGLLLTLPINPKQAGWLTTEDQTPRLDERTLFAGSFQNQSFISVFQYDLSNLPPGSRILFGVVELTGRDDSRLGTAGEWKLDLLDGAAVNAYEQTSFKQFSDARVATQVGVNLPQAQLGVGRVNRFELTAPQRTLAEKQLDFGALTFRLSGPTTGSNEFGWLSGSGTPTLYLVVVPGPFTIVTTTPTPANVLTAAAVLVRETATAQRIGTPTRARGIATTTPEPPIEYVFPSATPANVATAQFRSAYATAVAITTGTFTPVPPNVRLVTPTPTSLLVLADRLVSIPTSTSTPLASEYWSVTTPNELRGKIIAMSSRYAVTPSANLTPIPGSQLLGPAVDRNAFTANAPIVIDPANGQLIGLLTNESLHQALAWREQYSPDRKQVAYVSEADGLPQIYLYDYYWGTLTRITNVRTNTINRVLDRVAAYSPAWSPDGRYIAYVANETGADEIYIYDIENKVTARITNSDWYWNKHPSWSPDSKKIAFWSNRVTGRPQIWIMDANGENAYNISNSIYNDINPVWVK
jgi:hypothetical protein